MMGLADRERLEAGRLLDEWERRAQYTFRRLFPDCTTTCKPTSLRREDHAGLCRVLYRKHTDFLAAGAEHRERLFLAANQIGKTIAAAYEVTCHVTGLYPHWWEGRRFEKPTNWWVAGDTMLTTRDILQVTLMGPLETVDTKAWAGVIPAHLVADTTRRAGGVDKCLDQVRITHVTGGRSVIEFRSYDQGRRAFQGTAQDGVWLDEEPPDGEDIYSECLTRTITTDGLILTTFTPLRGLTPFLQQYLETAVMADATGETRRASDVVFPGGAP
jgi:phage terminase large subunit-like protein